jgi:serine protease Do
MEEIRPSTPTTVPSSPKPQKPGWCRIIALVVILSIVVSACVGFVVSGLGKALVSKITPRIIEKIEKVPTEVKEITVKEESATIEAVKKVRPAVVSIVVTKELKQIYEELGFPWREFGEDPFFREFFKGTPFEFRIPKYQAPEKKEKREIGGGSGFIITPDGLILTNKHVVADKTADYTVITHQGTKYPAKVKAIDPVSDIAFLKIEAKDLPTVELGDSDALVVGQTVIAIGNPLGQYPNTVTRGIVSGLGRAIVAGGILGQAPERLENVIQTDAAINPGNSGGPLVNIDGQVVGINTAIDLKGQLIGFAIPINEVKESIELVKAGKELKAAFLGIRYLIITPELAKANKLPVDYGALIVRGERRGELAVMPGSPADKAGLEENDIILEFNGQRIDQEHTLASMVRKRKPGDVVELKILHKGEEKVIKVELGELE